MKKKALVLLLVLSLVIGTFTGLTFMTASTALAEGESTFVTENSVFGTELITNGSGTSGKSDVQFTKSNIAQGTDPSKTSVYAYKASDSEAAAVNIGKRSTAGSDKDGNGYFMHFPTYTNTDVWKNNAVFYLELKNRVSLYDTYVVSAYVRVTDGTTGVKAHFTTATYTQHLFENTSMCQSSKMFALNSEWTKVEWEFTIKDIAAELAGSSTVAGSDWNLGLRLTAAAAVDIDVLSMKQKLKQYEAPANATELIQNGNGVIGAKPQFSNTSGQQLYTQCGVSAIYTDDADGNGIAYLIPTRSANATGNRVYIGKAPLSTGKYLVSMWVKFPNTTDEMTMYFGYGDNTGTSEVYPGSGGTTRCNFTFKGGIWNRFTYVIEIKNADKAGLGFCTYGTAATQEFLIDGFSVVKVEGVDNYGSNEVRNGSYGSNIILGNTNIGGITSQEPASSGRLEFANDADGNGLVLKLTKDKAVSGTTQTRLIIGGSENKEYRPVSSKIKFSMNVLVPENAGTNTITLSIKDASGNVVISETKQISDKSWHEFVLEPTNLVVGANYSIVLESSVLDMLFIDKVFCAPIVNNYTLLMDYVAQEFVPLTVKTEGNGQATVKNYGTTAKIPYGSQVTLVASSDTNPFIGWFKGNDTVPVSTDKEYVITATKEALGVNELTAKFSNFAGNTVTSGELVSIVDDVPYIGKGHFSTGGHPVYYNHDSGNSFASIKATETAGDYYSVPVASNAGFKAYRMRSTKIAVTEATAGKYIFSVYLRLPNAASNTFPVRIGANPNANTNTPMNNLGKNATEVKVSKDWKLYTVELNLEAGASYWLQVQTVGNEYIGSGLKANNEVIDIKGISLKKVEDFVTLDVKVDGEGTVSGTKTVLCGGKTTLTATPNGGSFVGWYVNNKLVSQDDAWTVTANAEILASANIVAKFSEIAVEFGVEHIVNGNAEKTGDIYLAGQTTKVFSEYNNGTGTSPNMSTGAAATLLNGADADGNGKYFALATNTNTGYDYASVANRVITAVQIYKNENFLPLEVGKTYTVSAYLKLHENAAVDTANVHFGLGQYYIHAMSDQSKAQASADQEINKTSWTKVSWTFTFNGGTEAVKTSEKYLALNYSTSGANYAVYLDGLSLKDTTKSIPMTYNVEGYGSVEGAASLAYGQPATITAKEDCSKFVGWYVDGKLYSTNATLTFDEVTVDTIPANVLTAKFELPNYMALTGDFENGSYVPFVEKGAYEKHEIKVDSADPTNHVLYAQAGRNYLTKFASSATSAPEIIENAVAVRVTFKVRTAVEGERTLARLTSKITFNNTGIYADANKTELFSGTTSRTKNVSNWWVLDRNREITNEWTTITGVLLIKPQTVSDIKNSGISTTGKDADGNNITNPTIIPEDVSVKDIQLYLTQIDENVLNGNVYGSRNETYNGVAAAESLALEYDDVIVTPIGAGGSVVKENVSSGADAVTTRNYVGGKALDLNYHTVTVDIPGSADAEVVINDGKIIPSYTTDNKVVATVLSGSEITVTAKDNDNYVLDKIAYADQKNGDDLAENGVATLVAYGTTTNLVAKFDKAGENVRYATLKYVIDGRDYIFDKIVIDEHLDLAALEANVPQLYGKGFKNFTFGEVTDYAAIKEAILAAQGDVVIEAEYELNEEEITEKPVVSANNGAIVVPAKNEDYDQTTGETSPFAIVTFKADAVKDEANFAYWQDLEGNVVSTKSNYTCYVVASMKLTPVYVDDVNYVESKAQEAEKAAVTIKAVDTDGKFVFVADRSAAPNVIIQKYGVIISEFEPDELLTVYDKGTYEDGRVIVSERVNGTTTNGTYVVTKGIKDANGVAYTSGKVLYARAYVIIDGEYIYSAQIQATLK